jgi:hypothetical protein
MGAQGNSFSNVTTFLTELAGASARAGRKILSNVELFEVWPTDCPWSPSTGACHGRHPGEPRCAALPCRDSCSHRKAFNGSHGLDGSYSSLQCEPTHQTR